MILARNMGLPVPKVSLYGTKDPFYIIERFDRKPDQKNHLMRIHQEDFCQAWGVLSEQKYESEGGPSLKNCFDLVRQFSISPAIDIKNIINWVVFNYIVGNADAHGKNLTLLSMTFLRRLKWTRKISVSFFRMSSIPLNFLKKW